MPDTDDRADSPITVLTVLEEAQRAGFLGPGPVERHLRHAEGFVQVARHLLDQTPRTVRTDATGPTMPRLLDLGSGGGLPGLVMAAAMEDVSLVLLDANSRRTGFLSGALVRLRLGGKVIHGRAELAGRDPALRGTFDGVVVRSFGPPAVVAECAAPFLRRGGWLVVSEPPVAGEPESGPIPHRERWPAPGLSQLGLEPTEFISGEFGYQILSQVELCSERFSRRDGVPAKNPLF